MSRTVNVSDGGLGTPAHMRYLEYLCERAGIDDYCRRRIAALDALDADAVVGA